MDRKAFADRYRIELTYATDGTCTVRVTDVVTWRHKEATGLEQPTEEIAHSLASNLYPDLLMAPPPVARISLIDGYRDGGSIGMSYHAQDKQAFEFFLPVAFTEDRTQFGYRSPVLFFEHVNTKRVAYNFTWEEAERFLSGLNFDEPKLGDMLTIVRSKGSLQTC